MFQLLISSASMGSTDCQMQPAVLELVPNDFLAQLGEEINVQMQPAVLELVEGAWSVDIGDDVKAHVKPAVLELEPFDWLCWIDHEPAYVWTFEDRTKKPRITAPQEIIKQPAEDFFIAADFKDLLLPGEDLLSIDSIDDGGASVVGSSMFIVGSRVIMRATGGSDGQSLRVQTNVQTTRGFKRSGDGILIVSDTDKH